MTTAKVFMSGNSQAVRLPKDFRINADEVELSRDGEKVVLTPKTRTYGKRLVELLNEFSDGLELPDEDLPPQKRPNL